MGIDEFDSETADPTTRQYTPPPPLAKPPRDRMAWALVWVLLVLLVAWVVIGGRVMNRMVKDKRAADAFAQTLQDQLVESRLAGGAGDRQDIPTPPTMVLPNPLRCTLDDNTIVGIGGMLQHIIDKNEQRDMPVFGPCR